MSVKFKEIEERIRSQNIFKNRPKLYALSKLRESRLCGEEYFCFNLRVISTEMLDFLKNNDIFEDVIFHTSAPPPGHGADSISFRYTVHAKPLSKEE